MKVFPLLSLLIASARGFLASPRTRPSTTNKALFATFEEDTCVTLVPKFQIKEGHYDAYMAVLPKFLELVKANEQDTCLFYSFVGPTEEGWVICREGYVDADGLLKHLENVGAPFNEALEHADILSFEVQGPAAELEKLKEPLKDFGTVYYPIQPGGIRRVG